MESATHPSPAGFTQLVAITPLQDLDPNCLIKGHSNTSCDLVLIESGCGTLMIDNRTMDISGQQILALSPGQFCRWQHGSVRLKGIRLQLNPDFPEPVSKDVLFFHRFQFFYNSRHPTFYQEAPNTFDRYFKLATNLYHEMTSPYSDRHEMGWSYISLLLVQLHRNYCEAYGIINERRIHTEAYRFKQLVENHIRNLQKVEDYAEMLQLSRITLNKVVRAQYGLTATDYLKDRLAMEVIRELLNTGKPIAKISEDLLFSEPSSLIRFFRNKTGASPHAFRLANRN